MSFSADEIGTVMSTNKNREAIVGFNKVDGGEPGFGLTAIPTVPHYLIAGFAVEQSGIRKQVI